MFTLILEFIRTLETRKMYLYLSGWCRVSGVGWCRVAGLAETITSQAKAKAETEFGNNHECLEQQYISPRTNLFQAMILHKNNIPYDFDFWCVLSYRICI